MSEESLPEDARAEYTDALPEYAERVLDVTEMIPPGRVMTYGDVAASIGSRSARGVGQVMAYYGSDVPWWRVVRASGHPPQNHEQRALEYYRSEGTPLIWSRDGGYRVDFALARWSPGSDTE